MKDDLQNLAILDVMIFYTEIFSDILTDAKSQPNAQPPKKLYK